MVPFGLLLVSLLVFKSLGALGVEPLSSWHNAAACALAVMFLFTASAHFTRTKRDLISMVPGVFPRPELLVSVTGVLEVLGAAGLLVPATRGLAGIGLILLLVAMFPANAAAARKGVPLRGEPLRPLPLRLSLQLVFIGMTGRLPKRRPTKDRQVARMPKGRPVTRANGLSGAHVVGTQIVRAPQTAHQTIRRIRACPT